MNIYKNQIRKTIKKCEKMSSNEYIKILSVFKGRVYYKYMIDNTDIKRSIDDVLNESNPITELEKLFYEV